MTGFALYTNMVAAKRVFGLGVVIEDPKDPAVRVMAPAASCPERWLVYIVSSVAIAAGHRRFLIRRRDVAFLAGQHRMLADHWKVRVTVMVERALPPILRIVTGDTFHLEGLLLQRTDMTSATSGFPM
jgi:hypothetical protein